MSGEIKVGDRVRVKDGCQSAKPGEVFTVTEIYSAPNPYTWDGIRHHPNPAKPDWYAMGDGNCGVWAQYVELAEDYAGAVDQVMFDLERSILREDRNDSEARVRRALTFAYEQGWGGV